MKRMYHYAPASKAVKELHQKGFLIDYNIEEQTILDHPEDFEIVHLYRYEGMSNPDDESTVYGIARKDGSDQGLFVAGNLSFADNKTAKILLKIEIEGKQNEKEGL